MNTVLDPRAVCILLALSTAPAPAQDYAAPSLPFDYFGTDLQLDQNAWDDPLANIGPDQHTPGHRICANTPNTICQARVRYGLITTIRLDPSERIVRASISDPTAFEASTFPAGPNNVIEIKPRAAGIDATLMIYTQDGTLYPVRLASKTHLEPTITDIIVDIQSRRPATAAPSLPQAPPTDLSTPAPPATLDATHSLQSAQLAALAGTDTAKGGVWGTYGNLEIHDFDPAKLVYDMQAWANTEEAARLIGPVRVFRDDKWTYVDYSNRIEVLQRWPSVMRVTDNTESPIATRVAGPNGEILIIEGIGDFVLRSNDAIICLKINRTPVGPPLTVVRTAPQPPPVVAPTPSVASPEPDTPRVDLIVHLPDDHSDALRATVQQIIRAEAPYAHPTNGRVPGVALLHAQRACYSLAKIGVTCEAVRRSRP